MQQACQVLRLKNEIANCTCCAAHVTDGFICQINCLLTFITHRVSHEALFK